MDQTFRQCFLRAVAIGRQQNIKRVRSAHGRHQIADRRQAIAQSQTSGRNRKRTWSRGNANIAAQRQVQAPANAIPVNAGNRWLEKVIDRELRAFGDTLVFSHGIGGSTQCVELGDICTAHEGLATGTGQDHGTDVVILLEKLQGLWNTDPHVKGHRVVTAWIIEGDPAHCTLFLNDQAIGHFVLQQSGGRRH